MKSIEQAARDYVAWPMAHEQMASQRLRVGRVKARREMQGQVREHIKTECGIVTVLQLLWYAYEIAKWVRWAVDQLDEESKAGTPRQWVLLRRSHQPKVLCLPYFLSITIFENALHHHNK